MANLTRITAIVASTAAAGLGGAVIAGAADKTNSTTPTTPGQHDGRGHGGPGGPRGNETALTGDTKTKVEAAALAKVSGGTILRSETDEGGVYEAHVKKSDGTEVEVKVDKDFKVTSVETRPAGGPGGKGGHGGPGGHGFHADLAAVAKDLDVTQAKLQSAVEAARPDKPTAGTKGDPRGDDAAAIAKSLGVSTADVQAFLDANRPDRGDRGGRGPGGLGKPDDSTLVKALAKKFSVSEAKAQAAVDAARKAHDAERTAKQAEMYAAIAKSLGKDAADVKKAFEANQPVRPTAPAPTTP